MMTNYRLTMISPEQCRAVRAWLRISQKALADEAGLSEITIRVFEREERRPLNGTVLSIQVAVERLGFVITETGIDRPKR